MAIIINGTSGISGVDGSAGTPALQGLDPNTGISFGTDTVNLVTGGTTRATVDSSGNIDLGPLDINGSASDDSVNIDASGRLLHGHTSAVTNLKWGGSGDFGSRQYIYGANQGVNNGLAILNYDATASIPALLRLGSSRNDTPGNNTVVGNNDTVASIQMMGNDGTRFIDLVRIDAVTTETGPGSGDMPGMLRIGTTADGASVVTTRLQLHAAGYLEVQGVYDLTTSAGANVYVHGNGYLQRSTSSIKYKTDVETLEDSYADALLECRPVWYRSTCSTDDPAYGYWGFIAEEVAEIDPRLVHWKTTNPVQQEDGSVEHVPCEPEPEGVQYDRFVPHLINLIKRQKEQLESQAATIAALDARLTALEGGAA